MRVLVCGSRDWADRDAIWCVLNGILRDNADVVVIQGGARGADYLALRWAYVNHQPNETHPADWSKHDRAAGPIRNQQMLDEGKPDLVWAFTTKPLGQSKGTADMVSRAVAAGIPVYVVRHGDLG